MENNLFLFIGSIGIPELMLLLVLVGIPGVLWIWALIDLLTSRFANSLEKLIWLVAVIFVPVLGAILYLLIGRRQKIQSVSR